MYSSQTDNANHRKDTEVIGIIVGVAILVIVIAVLLVGQRRGAGGVVQLSHLKCPKCGSEFDYAYVPGASFTSVRLGGSRFLRCPVCHKWSVFNIWNTRVDPNTHHCGVRIGPS